MNQCQYCKNETRFINNLFSGKFRLEPGPSHTDFLEKFTNSTFNSWRIF